MISHAVSRVIHLISEDSQRLWTTDESEARRRLLASDVDGVLGVDGSFALVVHMASGFAGADSGSTAALLSGKAGRR